MHIMLLLTVTFTSQIITNFELILVKSELGKKLNLIL